MECVPRGRLSLITPTSTPVHRPRNEMKWRNFLTIPKKHRRARSGAKSEVGSLKDPSAVDLVAPRPTESTPDLRIGTSAFPMPSPLTSHDQQSNGMQTAISWTIHLTVILSPTQTPTRFPIKSYLLPEEEETKAMVTTRNPRVILLTRRPHLREN